MAIGKAMTGKRLRTPIEAREPKTKGLESRTSLRPDKPLRGTKI
ncbi:hypothetical protein CCACVL1_24612 [Corchorus capsularis]|uniref:Uncharacterized protein n=1 Tax=Corchorus capsularis TaxID=210143 RepID=A0A1R3GP00_COCAP|nr:hypothetical protein CCACVL1_24612 [Corchorus capsularis]